MISSKKLTIFHFNDVYNIEPATIEPVGGASRLVTAYNWIKERNPIVLFSGDCLNPSLISSVEKGSQMLPVFEHVNLTCAVLGNHEFDFGMEILEEFMDKCKFPWLLSNVIDRCTGKPLAGAKETFTIEWEGVKIGMIGLAEEEWLVTLPTLDLTDMVFINFIESARDLSKQLKAQGADIIIALTHMTMKNDVHLLEEVEDIDLVFGGHDHHYCIEEVNGRYVIKSGSDFQNASVVTLDVSDGNKLLSVNIEELTLDSKVPEDPDMKRIVDQYLEKFKELAKAHLGYSDSDLDGLFTDVRTRETNLGNLIADIMVESTGADIALLNSGTLRSNLIHPAGPFTNKDLLRILPLFDQLCVLDVTGEQLHMALENGVSRYPGLDGRFPQISGFSFEFDPTQKPGERVNPKSINVNGLPLDFQEHYRLCVKEYVARGRDGYDCLRECPVIVACQAGPVLATAVQNYFEGVYPPCKHRGCLHSHCNPDVTNKDEPIISHHTKSTHAKKLKHVPAVEGRIRMTVIENIEQ